LHPARNNNPLPRILVDHPDQVLAIKKFIKTQLEGLTAESMRAYIQEIILPNIAVRIITNNTVDECNEEV
jgi:hypothetical protein